MFAGTAPALRRAPTEDATRGPLGQAVRVRVWAMGLLMAAVQVAERDASRRLQKTARKRNLRLAEVALARD